MLRSRFLHFSLKFCSFLQFGSPHSLMSQPQYIAAERSEVWVNIGYRLSAFGFLASDEPDLHGNYGFMDQYLALEWIRDNIEVFGGKLALSSQSTSQVAYGRSRSCR